MTDSDSTPRASGRRDDGSPGAPTDDTVVLGREGDGATGPPTDGPVAALGTYRARDGTAGAPVALDVDRPHAVLVVGKRGHGKSYTLGVLAEELARTGGVAPVVADPVGAFGGLADPAAGEAVPASVVEDPTVSAGALPPPAWCDLLDLAPADPAGALVWRAAATADGLEGMRDHVADADAPRATRRAAANHLRLAADWDVFDPTGGVDWRDGAVTVLDLSELDAAPANAVLRGVARGVYDDRVAARSGPLPWLLVDEAHAFFGGLAGPALRTVLTRGRAPGVSLAVATQRPAALPPVAVSQSDVVVAHRLTAEADLEALAAARPTYVGDPLAERLPERPGEALVVDDATESVHAVRVRERDTPHRGHAPRASEAAADGD